MSHLVMAPIAAIMAAVLVLRAEGVGHTISALVFGVLLVGLFATSGSYHLPRWTARTRARWGRADTAMIVLYTAGTFTPIAFHALDGSWRLWSLVIAWVIATGGAAIALSPLEAPRWLAAGGFLAMGWLAVVPLWRVAAALPITAMALIILGGVLYSIGAVVYVRKKPNPAPTWFGFHEIFHLFVVAASVCHYIVILRYVVT